MSYTNAFDPIDEMRMTACLTRMEATVQAVIALCNHLPLDLVKLEHLREQFLDAQRTYHEITAKFTQESN